MSSSVTMEDLVRPNAVEGRKRWVEYTLDEAVSQIVFVVKYLRDGADLGNRKVALSDGSIQEAAKAIYDAAVEVAKGQGKEPGDDGYPEMTDVAAVWTAAKGLATDPAKSAEDMVALLAGKDWGVRVLKQAYGL